MRPARDILAGLLLGVAGRVAQLAERVRLGPAPDRGPDVDANIPPGHPLVELSPRALEMRADGARPPPKSAFRPPDEPLAGSAAARQARATSRG